MVKINSILIFSVLPNNPILLNQSHDFSNVSWFYRSKAEEVARFIGRGVVSKVSVPARGGLTSNEGGQTTNVYYQTLNVPVPKDSSLTSNATLACTVLTDGDYPQRVAISLVGKILSSFINTIPFDHWATQSTDIEIPAKFVPIMLQQYQNPQEADDIEKIKKDLNETKDVIMESLDLLLKRGEKLEDLIERSNDLSATSKTFLKES
eukprot:TRINITY_DN8001_c0_g1_i2.p1 TRINITY_DN8001_c0_g1~~TRINITY_DN8001_c0_g1_i2.p1  ORF type:complete len:207 (+),score=43.14 TRINITY_DN8001_c0_g1_i2:117-737(+)